jgi:maleate cis-trans isomerase
MFGENGRIGLIVPANNAVLEPELGAHLPPGVALYATRVLARGDLTPEAVIAMESEVGRAADELAATGVDVIVYADMVTTFIMEDGWNETRTAEIAAEAGIPCISAWTALRDALAALGIRRFALGTPYPAGIHALARPFFEAREFGVTGDATLDITAMADVPKVAPERVAGLVDALDRTDAEAVVLLATDLPTLASIEAMEAATGLAVLSSNSCILWSALATLGQSSPAALGRLHRH